MRAFFRGVNGYLFAALLAMGVLVGYMAHGQFQSGHIVLQRDDWTCSRTEAVRLTTSQIQCMDYRRRPE